MKKRSIAWKKPDFTAEDLINDSQMKVVRHRSWSKVPRNDRRDFIQECYLHSLESFRRAGKFKIDLELMTKYVSNKIWRHQYGRGYGAKGFREYHLPTEELDVIDTLSSKYTFAEALDQLQSPNPNIRLSQTLHKMKCLTPNGIKMDLYFTFQDLEEVLQTTRMGVIKRRLEKRTVRICEFGGRIYPSISAVMKETNLKRSAAESRCRVMTMDWSY